MSRPETLDHEAAFAAQLERAIVSLRTTARRGLSEPLRGAVPILDRWMMPAPDGSDVPLPVLRVSPRRPDVADLARVVTEEPGGTVWAAWRWVPGHTYTADRLILDVKIMRPVRAAFLLAFTLPRDRWVLDAMHQGRRLGLTGTTRGDGPLLLLSLPVFAELGDLLAMLGVGD